jgi:serine protease AprX
MKFTCTALLSLIVTLFLNTAHAGVPGNLLRNRLAVINANDESVVMIYFTDKGTKSRLRSLNASSLLSQRSIERRARVRGTTNIIDNQDYPLEQSYVQTVSQKVVGVRHELKWFNALSVVATKQQIESLLQLPFVQEIELVSRWQKRPGDEEEKDIEYSEAMPTLKGTTALDYGTSYTQLNQINIPKVHDQGIYGQGVVVGVFDNGFRLLTHESFASMNIIAQYDFVDHKVSVIPNNPSTAFGSHGVNTLSTIGGYKPGQLIGPAFKADFILARTENDSSETPIEEDNWAAAIQWADSIGVDVTSTSLGYLTYDAPYTSWTWADMNGNATLITKAADRAVALGIVVVNSAGNEGAGDGIHNTLIAPADGDSVITAGAVTSSGVRSSFSSVGPTADGRTKPDIMAMGSGVKVASSTNTTGYGSASGTSFSCPLSAGVAALIRCANPTLTPMQVREAMRQTASKASAPDNLMGWGILNTDSAIGYYGIQPMGKISGTVFDDLNGNGIKEGGEPGIPNIKVHLDVTATDSIISDADGHYQFDSLSIGTYVITAELPNGWVQSTEPPGYTIGLLHMADTNGNNFGFYQYSAIGGTVFSDENRNGIHDETEPGLPGRTVNLTGPWSTSTQSDSLGNYRFTDIPPGTYTLSESWQPLWFQTLPNNYGTYTVAMTSGLDSTNFLFGNYLFPDSTYQIDAGWNLISLPEKLADHSISSIFPTASSAVFIYQSKYISLDTVSERAGFWIKSSISQNVNLQGAPRLLDTIDVVTGWNMIGGLSVPIQIDSIIQLPDSIVTSEFFDYRASAYLPNTTIEPFRGYWVKVKESGKLILRGALPSENKSQPK